MAEQATPDASAAATATTGEGTYRYTGVKPDYRKPARWGAWYATEHMLRGTKNYAFSVVLTSVGTPLVYLLGLGVGLAMLVDNSVGEAGIEGVSYLVFVAPALLATAAMQIGANEAVFPIFSGFKWNRWLHGMIATPLTPGQIVLGVAQMITIRMFGTCLIYFVIMAAFGAVPNLALGWLMILASLLCGLSIALPLMALSAHTEDDNGSFNLIFRLVLTPLFLLSGTFYPLTQLPVALQWIGWISPLWHTTQLGRIASFGYVEPVWLTLVHVAYPLALALVGYVLAARQFDRRLTK